MHAGFPGDDRFRDFKATDLPYVLRVFSKIQLVCACLQQIGPVLGAVGVHAVDVSEQRNGFLFTGLQETGFPKGDQLPQGLDHARFWFMKIELHHLFSSRAAPIFHRDRHRNALSRLIDDILRLLRKNRIAQPVTEGIPGLDRALAKMPVAHEYAFVIPGGQLRPVKEGKSLHIVVIAIIEVRSGRQILIPVGPAVRKPPGRIGATCQHVFQRGPRQHAAKAIIYKGGYMDFIQEIQCHGIACIQHQHHLGKVPFQRFQQLDFIFWQGVFARGRAVIHIFPGGPHQNHDGSIGQGCGPGQHFRIRNAAGLIPEE